MAKTKWILLVSRYKNELKYADDIQYALGPFKSLPKARKYASLHGVKRYASLQIDKPLKKLEDSE